MQIFDFEKFKNEKRKISMLTCYDYWTACIANQSHVDCLLVGDSLSMVMHGENSTVAATMTLMEAHTRAVAIGAPDKFIVGDLPFLSYRGSLDKSLKNIDSLMKAGAQAVKLEGILGNETLISHLVESGIPVMTHLGLTPQSVNGLGGYKVQGKDPATAERLVEHAKRAQDLGSFALVLECIPTSLAKRVTETLNIPTIGIGAGPVTDGQVLVMQDMLGAFPRSAKFVRRYAGLNEQMREAFDQFDRDVKDMSYPNSDESYNL